jgi:hypothetical protein
VQPAPIRDTGEDERSGSRGDEAGEERTSDLLRRDLPARSGHLEEEERGDQRSSEERGYSCECARESEKLSACALGSNELDRECAHPESQRDQRSLGTENESEAEGRECGGEDARQCDRCDWLGAETFEGRVPTVTR